MAATFWGLQPTGPVVPNLKVASRIAEHLQCQFKTLKGMLS
jgi:hypothetical protein